MPGPGGGSHGGGFGGGSHGGRAPGGSPHRGFRRPYYGRRRGCFGSFMGMLMLPIILVLIVVVLLFGTVGSAFTNLVNGGQIKYDETKFQAYADKQYAAEFGSSTAYEDNLLIVFLANEDADGYYTIAWVGDNIKSEINELFGNEYTAFGRAMTNSVNESYYAYSLDSNLASVVDAMTDTVLALGLDSSFYSETSHTGAPSSHVTNYTDLSITAETVNRALEEFTEQTGIPAVIVVDSMETVFGKSVSIGNILVILITIGLIVLAVYLIVRAIRVRKEEKNNHTGGGYSDDIVIEE